MPGFVHLFQYSLMQSSSRHLGSKPILWVLDSTGHSLRKSIIIIIIIIIIVVVVVVVVVIVIIIVVVVVVVVVVVIMIMFLTYNSFISLLDTEGGKKVNVARIILERIQQLTGRDNAQQHGS